MKTFHLLAAASVAIVGASAMGAPAAAPAIAWQASWAKTEALAGQKRKPILLYFGATWCGPCHKLEKETLSQTSVIRASRRWVPFHSDLDQEDDLVARFSVETPPTLLFLDTDGRVLDKVVGFYSAAELVAKMDAAAQKSSSPRS